MLTLMLMLHTEEERDQLPLHFLYYEIILKKLIKRINKIVKYDIHKVKVTHTGMIKTHSRDLPSCHHLAHFMRFPDSL